MNGYEYRFGSARNLFKDNSEVIPVNEYVELTFKEVGTRKSYSLKSIANMLEDGKVVVLLADFGSGKSLT